MNGESPTAPKDPSFALENVLPGTFVLQGILGGILGGLIYVWTTSLCGPKPNFNETLLSIPLVLFLGAILGAIEALIFWIVYLASDLRMSAGIRAALMINTLGVIALFLGGFSLRNDDYFSAYLVIALLCALPTALLVGSRVKPWGLFTFGSIAVYDKAVRKREGSRNVPATLGSLPLRFLSLFVLVIWILKFSCERKFGQDVISTAEMFVTPAVYPALCAYVSFRSPRKWSLLTMGIAINPPLGLISTAAFVNRSDIPCFGSLPLTAVYLAFVIAWGLFLTARLNVRTSQPMMAALGFSGLLMQAKKFRSSTP
jgi:hypothetical protein